MERSGNARRILLLAGCLLAVLAAAPRAQALTDADIQAAIDALPPEGGVVQLEATTYTINDTIWLRDYVILKGVGMDQTVLYLADNVNKAMIRGVNYDENVHWTEGNHDFAVKDLTIDGNNAHNSDVTLQIGTSGILYQNCYNYRVENLHVVNTCGYGAVEIGPNHYANQQGVPFRNYILNNHIEGTIGISWGDGTRHYGWGMFVTAYDNDNVLIRGNVCHDNAGAGIGLEDSIDFITVEYNHCYNNGNGITMDLTGRSIIRFNLLENNAGRGINAASTLSYEVFQGVYHMIYGNTIIGNGGEGIGLFYPGIDASQYSSYCVVVNNTVKNNCWQGWAGAGISIQYQGNVVAFNKVFDDQATPLPTTTSSATTPSAT